MQLLTPQDVLPPTVSGARRRKKNFGNWYIVASSSEVRKKPVAMVRFGTRLVFWRDRQGRIVVMPDKCPHRGAALSAGKLMAGRICCPYHGFQFSNEGMCAHVPTDSHWRGLNVRLKTYTAKESGDWIWLWRGPDCKPSVDPPEIAEIAAYDFHSEIWCRWSAHFTRVMEALIDFSHVPTVHAMTLARVTHGGPFDSIVVESRRRGFKTYNRNDPTGNYVLVTYPNLWVNWCRPDIFNVQAAVPVDGKSSLVYSRTYFKSRFAMLAPIAKIAFSMGSRYILFQDRRIVQTQLPTNIDDVDAEHLLPSDKPILAYRRLRKKYSGAETGRQATPGSINRMS